MPALASGSTCLMTSPPTPLGILGVGAARGRVFGVTLGSRTAAEARRRLVKLANDLPEEQACADEDENEELAAAVLGEMERYAQGDSGFFSNWPLALPRMTRFQSSIVAACRAIPYGQVRTYGELAAAAGSPGAARAVGQVMAANRVPMLVPCHRVVGAGGRLGGFSAPQGIVLKERMLAIEGVSLPSDPASMRSWGRLASG